MEAEAMATDELNMGSLFINWVDTLHTGRVKFQDLIILYLQSAQPIYIFFLMINYVQYNHIGHFFISLV